MYIENPLEIIKNNSVINHKDINVVYTENLKNKLKTKKLKNSTSMESVESIEIHPAVLTATQKHDLDMAKKLSMISFQVKGRQTIQMDGSWILFTWNIINTTSNLDRI